MSLMVFSNDHIYLMFIGCNLLLLEEKNVIFAIKKCHFAIEKELYNIFHLTKIGYK